MNPSLKSRPHNRRVAEVHSHVEETTPTTLTLLLCVICGFTFAGCGHPTRTTSQLVHFQVSWSETGQAVDEAGLECVYNYWLADPERASNRSGDEVYSGVTDEHGQAALDVRFVAVDRTAGSTPPPWRDWVTGHPYLIEVDTNGSREMLNLLLQVGTSVDGKVFTVKVLEIDEPRYLTWSEQKEDWAQVRYLEIEDKPRWIAKGTEGSASELPVKSRPACSGECRLRF